MNMQTKDKPLPRRCASCGHLNSDPRVGSVKESISQITNCLVALGVLETGSKSGTEGLTRLRRF
jgi:hypothetical protein